MLPQYAVIEIGNQKLISHWS